MYKHGNYQIRPYNQSLYSKRDHIYILIIETFNYEFVIARV